MALVTTRTSSTVSMEMKGLEALHRAMLEMPELVRDRLKDVIARATFRLGNAIKTSAPRGETGTLQRSITWRASGLTGRVEIGIDAFYWHYLEYGTVKLPARPFIRPAGEAEQPLFERDVIGVGRAIEQRWSRVT